MKFTEGYWVTRPGFTVLRGAKIEFVREEDGGLAAFVATKFTQGRGDTLNLPLLRVLVRPAGEGAISVTLSHHRGGVARPPSFALAVEDGSVEIGDLTVRSGALTARFNAPGESWGLSFEEDGRVVTRSIPRSIAHATGPDGECYVHEQLTLEPGESVYGLGERFGPLVKNGQSVDIWNEDGGTCSDLAYKNVPFYMSSRGYGVFVDDPGRVSFEVASEVVSRVQFSVPREEMRYFVIAGPTPKDVLRRYTALTGRPPAVPQWSFGSWLSTSFTTDYDEETVLSFVDGMRERDLPLSVFHFDCFWMRGYHWSDFTWDPDTFPDPEGLIAKLHERGLKVCVWINPYLAQQGKLFDEGLKRGFLVKRPDGSVWQWDMWQSGMALPDLTNPEAREWYVGALKTLLDQGVDCFKTDFGERIPTDVVWHDGSDPERMHNYYTHLYNEAVFELLKQERGEGEAVLFARSATAGGQQFPVHWGGDSESTYVSMAETLRGGLSLAASGFGYWSHDIGGFEGMPDPGVFKRWAAFGLLGSHSRFHGSGSYRVPWNFDDEAVEVVRTFSKLKMRLMPYLAGAAREVVSSGIPMMRPMVVEFPEDRTAQLVDTQYMLGCDLLVAPVFSESGDVSVYIPAGTWTDLLTGHQVTGPRWVNEVRDMMSIPIYVRPGAIIPMGSEENRPDYDLAEGVTLHAYGVTDSTDVEVPRGTAPDSEIVVVDVTVSEAGGSASRRTDGAAVAIEIHGGAQ